MRRVSLPLSAVGFLAIAALGFALTGAAPGGPEWAMNATAIEACSCPMFCQCYFNANPAGHHRHGGDAEHYCRFNNAYKVNAGHLGDVQLDGARFWISGDLGGDFSHGQMDWATLFFDKSLTAAQRDAIGKIAGQLFAVKWNAFTTAEGAIDTWKFDKAGAVALLDGGKTAEIRLKAFPGLQAGEPVVLRNLRYWGAPRNDGFVMMPNEVQALRTGPKAFETKGTNGFMITVDLNSNDFKPASAM